VSRWRPGKTDPGLVRLPQHGVLRSNMWVHGVSTVGAVAVESYVG